MKLCRKIPGKLDERLSIVAGKAVDRGGIILAA
jgi:hypothetical protein